jgi:hypothetical protein
MTMNFYHKYGTENPSGLNTGRAAEPHPDDVTQPRTYVYVPPGHPARQAYEARQAQPAQPTYQSVYYPYYSYPYYSQYPTAQHHHYYPQYVRSVTLTSSPLPLTTLQSHDPEAQAYYVSSLS